ncbi:carbohydrate kinase family protein [Candidatus Woesearchaeota archaeon]|nr:carbohydrate kinase family protein [Candidatus Woesearchaeota archaeon]
MDKTTSFDVVTCGSATLDIFVQTHPEIIVEGSPKKRHELMAYPLGSKIIVTEIQEHTGGGGSNSAVSFSKLGLKTGFIGSIAKDYVGLRVFQELKNYNITFLGVIHENKKTGMSIVLDAEGHDRTILIFKGCNNDLKPVHVKPFKTNWLYISTILGSSLKTVLKLTSKMQSELSIAFNPSEYMIKMYKKQVLKLLSMTSFTSMNREEAELLTGEIDIKKQLLALSTLGPELTTITDGPRSLAAFKTSTRQFFEIQPKKQTVVEATGAGDAFASGMLAGLIYNLGVEKSLKLGLLNAEHVIKKFGSKNGLLSKQQAFKLLSKDKRKVFVTKI